MNKWTPEPSDYRSRRSFQFAKERLNTEYTEKRFEFTEKRFEFTEKRFEGTEMTGRTTLRDLSVVSVSRFSFSVAAAPVTP
jgi:hypothetical protein